MQLLDMIYLNEFLHEQLWRTDKEHFQRILVLQRKIKELEQFKIEWQLLNTGLSFEQYLHNKDYPPKISKLPIFNVIKLSYNQTKTSIINNNNNNNNNNSSKIYRKQYHRNYTKKFKLT